MVLILNRLSTFRLKFIDWCHQNLRNNNPLSQKIWHVEIKTFILQEELFPSRYFIIKYHICRRLWDCVVTVFSN
jgi:hypothetical protein